MPQFQKDLGLSIKQSNLCLTGDSNIVCFDTINNTMWTGPIREFVEIHFNESKWKVWSYDIETDTCGWADVENAAMTNPSAEVYEIIDESTGKCIKCTGEHKIYTKNRGYVMAKDLVETDELLLG
jgi:intein/homing endonuclease